MELNGKTCVVYKDGEIVFSSVLSGIRPLIELIESGIDVKGCVAHDKIVGKAAALLYAYMLVGEVRAEVLSDGGEAVLTRYRIAHSAEVRPREIINRRGDGVCPMEAAVKDIDEPKAALAAVKAKLKELSKT